MPFLANSKQLWRVWLSVLRTSFVREMEFRTNFWMGIIREIVWVVIFIFIISVIFQNTQSLAGWNQAEVLVVLGLSRIVEAIMRMTFMFNIGQLPPDINSGFIDYILTKPVPAQWYIAFRRAEFYSFGSLFAGIALLAYAISVADIQPSLLDSLAALFITVLGITAFYSLLIMVATLAFFLERLEAIWAFFHLFTEPLTYPFDIFPRGPRIAMTYFIPLAFVVFVPAQALTGRLQLWQIPAAVGIAALFLLLANLAWRAGLRRYSSASS